MRAFYFWFNNAVQVQGYYLAHRPKLLGQQKQTFEVDDLLEMFRYESLQAFSWAAPSVLIRFRVPGAIARADEAGRVQVLFDVPNACLCHLRVSSPLPPRHLDVLYELDSFQWP